jgi:hypothetical protein
MRHVEHAFTLFFSERRLQRGEELQVSAVRHNLVRIPDSKSWSRGRKLCILILILYLEDRSNVFLHPR